MPGRRFDRFVAEDPPERPADPAVRRANFRRIVRLFRPYKARLAAVSALIVFSAALGVVSPFLLREVLDVAIPDENVGLRTVLVAGMVAIPIVTGARSLADAALHHRLGASQSSRARVDERTGASCTF
jgi:ATP-binding cassette, subfamily B, bacterial